MICIEGMVICIINKYSRGLPLKGAVYPAIARSAGLVLSICHSVHVVCRRCRSSLARSRLSSADSRMVGMQGQRTRIAAWINVHSKLKFFAFLEIAYTKKCCNKRLAWLLCYAEPGAKEVLMCWLIRPVAHIRDCDRCVWNIGGRTPKHSWREGLLHLHSSSDIPYRIEPMSSQWEAGVLFAWDVAQAHLLYIVILESINIEKVWQAAVHTAVHIVYKCVICTSAFWIQIRAYVYISQKSKLRIP
jgi:hypothetical protein